MTVTISKGIETKFIDTANSYRNACATNTTVEATESYIKDVLSGFDLSIVTSTHKDYDVGKIISITVNGSSTYSSGEYSINSKVVVTISKGYE